MANLKARWKRGLLRNVAPFLARRIEAKEKQLLRAAQRGIGVAGAHIAVKAWSKIAEKNDKVKNGEWVDDMLKERADAHRERIRQLNKSTGRN